MSPLNIVLVEPEIPPNTGNVARTCAAVGARLHLVGPLGFSIQDRDLKRAGLDYWSLLDLRLYEDLSDFFSRNPSSESFYFSRKAALPFNEVVFPRNCFLVFGRETSGLPEQVLLANRDRCVRIPIRAEARSLNLSNAVAIAAYECLRQWGFPGLAASG